ncbi:MAG: hypothetical protein KGD68_15355, partial [Candidatus Lokiarchaeota archaeon]|nr:hypothetical protein [Candidatus Lokiarchaeota archaeon]
EDGLWNVYILGIPNWFVLSNSNFLKIDENLISTVIQRAKLTFDKELREYTLNLDLSVIFSKE